MDFLCADDADGDGRGGILSLAIAFFCRNIVECDFFGDLLRQNLVDGTFLQDFLGFFGSDLLEIVLSRRDDEASHVERTRTDEHLVVALGKIAVGTVFSARKNDGNRRVALAPRHNVHHRLVKGVRCWVLGVGC